MDAHYLSVRSLPIWGMYSNAREEKPRTLEEELKALEKKLMAVELAGSWPKVSVESYQRVTYRDRLVRSLLGKDKRVQTKAQALRNFANHARHEYVQYVLDCISGTLDYIERINGTKPTCLSGRILDAMIRDIFHMGEPQKRSDLVEFGNLGRKRRFVQEPHLSSVISTLNPAAQEHIVSSALKSEAPSRYMTVGSGLLHRGSFGDLYTAIDPSARPVALKVLRLERGELTSRIRQRIDREVSSWRTLLKGSIHVDSTFTFLEGPIPAMVTRWRKNGNVLDYIRDNPTASKATLLWEMAQGLHSLHKANIVHGDLKGSNVLISDAGRVVLSDFGLIKLIVDITPPFGPALSAVGSVRYQAPEILDFEPVQRRGGKDALKGDRFSMESDIWAFGCVGLEIYTGQAPFYWITENEEVRRAVVGGVLPYLPEATISNEAQWGLLRKCWSYDPATRPKAVQLCEDGSWESGSLRQLLNGFKGFSSRVSQPCSASLPVDARDSLAATPSVDNFYARENAEVQANGPHPDLEGLVWL